MSQAHRVANGRVFVGLLCELGPASVRVVALAPDELGKPREVLVVRDASGTPRAYRNVCRHLPIPLDAASRSFLVHSERGPELLCATHGAHYRLSDGECVVGPCKGKALYAMELELVGDELFVVDP